MLHKEPTSINHNLLHSRTPCTLSVYLTGWNYFKVYHTTYQLSFPSLIVISIYNCITRADFIQTFCSFTTHSHDTMLIKGLWKQKMLTARHIPLNPDLLSLCNNFLLSFQVCCSKICNNLNDLYQPHIQLRSIYIWLFWGPIISSGPTTPGTEPPLWVSLCPVFIISFPDQTDWLYRTQPNIHWS